MRQKRTELSMVDRQHTSAPRNAVDVNIACQMRKLLECMSKLATNIWVRLDELALAHEHRKSKRDLVELTEDLQKCTDVCASELYRLVLGLKEITSCRAHT